MKKYTSALFCVSINGKEVIFFEFDKSLFVDLVNSYYIYDGNI